MLIPSILPDELAHGYQGRIQRVNMLASSLDTASMIKKTFLKENERDGIAERAIALARAAGMSLEKFFQLHTIMPFLRAATQVHPDIAHGSHERPRLIKKSGLRVPAGKYVACLDCIKEDLGYRGFAYWRRRHQIVGVPWCDKHLVPLFDIGATFNDSPSAKPIFLQADSIKGFDQLLLNPIINRYVDVVSGILDQSRPLSYTEASRKLSRRAQEQGIRYSKNGNRPTLSDIALDNLPKSWLSTIFPGIELKKSGAHFSSMDGVTLRAGTPQALALALAILFDSAEDAIKYWTTPRPDESSNNEALNGQNFWNSRKVFSTYVKSRGNRSEVGRALSFHSRRVSGELDRAGLPSLANVDFETTGRALLAFYSGHSLSEACVMHGANYTNCEELIRQAGARFAEAFRRIMRVPVSSRYAPTGLAEQDVETSQPNKMADHIIKTWPPLETAA